MKEKIERVIAVIDSWFTPCATCEETFIPTKKNNTRCLDCQLKGRSGEGEQ